MTKKNVNFDYSSSQASFMNEVKKTIVQQDDYRGMGGHGKENHGKHGEHTQASVGINNTTVNFREQT